MPPKKNKLKAGENQKTLTALFSRRVDAETPCIPSTSAEGISESSDVQPVTSTQPATSASEPQAQTESKEKNVKPRQFQDA